MGNITSQLFANIYLNELDYFIKQNLKIKYYVRYCDDFVILDKNRGCLERIIFSINEFLRSKLKLSLHKDKIIIKKHHQGIDFLGYVDFPHYRVLRIKTKKRMFKKIKINRQRLKTGLINDKSFRQSLQSYYGILKHCDGYKLKKEVEIILRKE